MTLTDYLSVFPGASREKPRFMALAEAILTQVTDLQAVVSGLPAAFSLQSATGIQLDLLANSLGLSREDITSGDASDDDVFRNYLILKMILWTWTGTNEDARRVLSAMMPGASMKDGASGSVSFTLPSALPSPGMLPIPAGVRAAVTVQP